MSPKLFRVDICLGCRAILLGRLGAIGYNQAYGPFRVAPRANRLTNLVRNKVGYVTVGVGYAGQVDL